MCIYGSPCMQTLPIFFSEGLARETNINGWTAVASSLLPDPEPSNVEES